jgi:hypothetical protein
MDRQMTKRWVMGAAAPISLALALGLAGCSDSPTQVADVAPPAPPQGVYSVTGDEQVTIHWIKNTERDFSQYSVWRGPDFDGPYTRLGFTEATMWIDDTANNAETYFYAISAIDRSGNESEFSEESVFDTPRPEGSGLVLVNYSQEPDGPSGYDFSMGVVRLADDPNTDVFFDAGGGVWLLVARDINTDVQDAGYRDIQTLDWAPDDGWSPTGEAELIPGHSYYVWTRDNHYAKVECVTVNDDQVVLNWAYQLVPGNPELKPHPRGGLGGDSLTPRVGLP